MSDNLKSKTKKGLVWSMIERFATQGVQFLFGIILARLLSPEDYGTIAMPLVFLAIAQCFIDSGFSTALIRKPNLTEDDLSTAFYFNIGVGVVCYLALFFSSPLIADFYNTPILADLLKVTALATLFNPLCAVQQAILTRKIDFKTQAVVSLSGAIVSGVVGLLMAYNGYGVWSLVFQQVGGYLIRTVLLWVLGKWKPKRRWSWDSFHYLWGFGSKMLGSGLLDTTYNNIFPIVIGKFFSAVDLGNYTRAQQFSTLPSSNLTGVLQRVTFPVLSSKYGLKVIYDAAHAFGVEVNGESILNAGDMSTLSFHATKVYNTIEGGAMIMHDEKTKQRIDYLKNFGFAGETTVVGPGINSKMDEMRSAYGLLNLKQVDAAIEARHQVAIKYREALRPVEGITFFDDMPGVKHNYSYFPIFVDAEKYGMTRDELYAKMKAANVLGRRYFYPLISEFSTYRGLESAAPENLPNAHKMADSVICLPMHHALSDEDVQRTLDCIIK